MNEIIRYLFLILILLLGITTGFLLAKEKAQSDANIYVNNVLSKYCRETFYVMNYERIRNHEPILYGGDNEIYGSVETKQAPTLDD